MSRTIGPFASIRLALAFTLLVAHTVAFTAGGQPAQPPADDLTALTSVLRAVSRDDGRAALLAS
jgi:hypothetical protein